MYTQLEPSRQKRWAERVPQQLKIDYVEEAIKRLKSPKGTFYNLSLQNQRYSLYEAAYKVSGLATESQTAKPARRTVRDRMIYWLKKLDLETKDPEHIFVVNTEPFLEFIRDAAAQGRKSESKQAHKQHLIAALAERWPDCPVLLAKQISELPTKHKDLFDIARFQDHFALPASTPAVYAAIVDRERKRHDARLSGGSSIFDDSIITQIDELSRVWEQEHTKLKRCVAKYVHRYEELTGLGTDDAIGETYEKLFRGFVTRDQLLLGPEDVKDPVAKFLDCAESVVESFYRSEEGAAPEADEAESDVVIVPQDVRDAMRREYDECSPDAHAALAAVSSLLMDEPTIVKGRSRRTCKEHLEIALACLEVLRRWIGDERDAAKVRQLLRIRDDRLDSIDAGRLYRKLCFELVNKATCEWDVEWRRHYSDRLPVSNARSPGTRRSDGTQVKEGTDYARLRRRTFGRDKLSSSKPIASEPERHLWLILEQGVSAVLSDIVIEKMLPGNRLVAPDTDESISDEGDALRNGCRTSEQ